MNQETLKKKLLEGYLKQQKGTCSNYAPSVASSTGGGGGGGSTSKELVQVDDVPENITLEEFKNYVKKWLEIDNMIKKVQEALKEKRMLRDKLSQVITGFMCKYNIEDLNTKEGRIRCRVSQVKAPLNKRVIKEKITDYFKNDENKKEEFIQKVYEERDKVEKVSLRRLKIT